MPYIHEHPVIDTDRHFIIDPITRAVNNAESKKNTLIQHDHNSERFTFEIPREVDGHDMTLCNSVQIHYINIESGSSKKNTGIYEVLDFPSDVEEEIDGNLTFSWVVSGNATEYAGTLNFLISFICIIDGVATYRWNTGINSSIVISKGIFNDESIVESYPDILSQWRKELFETNYAYQAALNNGFKGTEAEWLESLKGLSAYEVALRNGYGGSETEWLNSLKEGHQTFIVKLGTNWTTSANGVIQRVEVLGLLADDAPLVDVVPADDIWLTDVELEAFEAIRDINTYNDVILVRAYYATTTEITIRLIVPRSFEKPVGSGSGINNITIEEV